ncbi:hypothetical protein HYH39_09665 [Clostridium botulinum]|nr:hypothetical protein KU40_01530 [Clostridium botulinum]MBY6779212.1 hypothetical protein [Clostridium botulinum]MBY6852390.1 hypothetical protein [Clostridium botulinum]NFF23212.1 hypothetical protein [Clostridium botulinum]NFF35019.1 hypothetical protein [Clostridium botulinum]
MNLIEDNVNVEIKIKKNKLQCEIILNNIETECAFEYAFYLLYNKTRIDTKYYTIENFADFYLKYDGEYSVVGFIKYKDKKCIKTSETISFKFDEGYYGDVGEWKKKSITISIFGSCVSRDLLEFDRNKKYDLKTYVARQSVISAVSTPLKCEMESINLQSKFQKSMVYNDFTKETFEKFNNDLSEYLIIDLIDERFNIVDYNGSILTLSNELKVTNFFCNNKENIYDEKICKIKNWKIYKIKKKLFGYSYMFKNNLLEKIMDEFCDKLMKIYDNNKIIIHKAYMVDKYIDKSGKIVSFPENHLLNNTRINDRLKYMYNYLEEKLPNVFVIDICHNFRADENHKWGLAPMHYQDEYYITALNQLEKNIFNTK